MFRRILLTTAAVASVLVVSVGTRHLAAGPEPALKSLHLLNLPASITEADFVAALSAMNAAIAEAGYPHAGYRLWKVTGDQTGDFAYLFEGNWPNQEAYDIIHSHAAYEAAGERLGSFWKPVMEAQVYNRYVEIPLEASGEH